MSKHDVFIIFPYLKTTEPVRLRNILLRSSNDLEGLSSEQQAHLKTLFAMFFLRNDLHIKQMIYAHLEVDRDPKIDQSYILPLYDVQTLINYLYSTPHPTMGDPFLRREDASMYIFMEDKVYTGLIWPSDPHVDGNIENLSTTKFAEDKNIDGYYGHLNGKLPLWVTAGNRIYPPVPYLSLNISQDLCFDLTTFTASAKNWAWVYILQGIRYENLELEERLFRAMEWHNRSTAEGVDEEEALLHLAVAFESLLNLENNDKITARFQETVFTLLGSVPRLDSWLEQFYNDRSSVAHKGKAQQYMFYAMDWDKDKGRRTKVYEGKDPNVLQYRSLTMYGRRIFRLCLNAIISSARMAEEDGLSSLFVHNQERLEKICQQLKKAGKQPEECLRSIAKDVSDLHDHGWSSQRLVQSETLVKAGKLVLKTYLSMKPILSDETDALVQKVLQELQQQDTSNDKKLHLFKGLIVALGQNQDGNAMHPSPFEIEHPFVIVSSLLKYVTNSSFLFRERFHSQESKPESPEST